MAKFFLPNPGFELGNQDWTLQSGWSIQNDAVNSRNGAWLAQFTGSFPNSALSANFGVRPGMQFSIDCWIDGEDATAGDGLIILSWRDTNLVTMLADDIDGTVIAFGQTGYLQSSVVNGVVPDRAKYMYVQIRVQNAPNGSTWYVDDVTATGPIIETIPASAIIRSHRMVPAETVGVFDPLVGPDKISEFNAGMSDKWAGVFTFIPAIGADLGELLAFLRRIGKTERFFAFDPDRRTPLNGVVNGMTVDGATTNGTNRIPIANGPVSSTPLVAGDYFEIKDQYFQLQRDLEIGPEGTGAAIVWPSVRSTLADGEDVITDNPVMVARITSDLDWRRVEANPVDVSVSWEEV